MAYRSPIAARCAAPTAARSISLVDVHAGLSAITVARQGYPLATHERLWAKGKTITMPAHVEAAAQIRHLSSIQPAVWQAVGSIRVRPGISSRLRFTPTGFDGEVA